MQKNNIFESIENNEIVKNLVDDSKKIFDEFLGLVQGKKIREGNTALSEGTSEGTSSSQSNNYKYVSTIDLTSIDDLILNPSNYYIFDNNTFNEKNLYIIDTNELKKNITASEETIKYSIDMMLILNHDIFKGIIINDQGGYTIDGLVFLLREIPKNVEFTQMCASVPKKDVHKITSSVKSPITDIDHCNKDNGIHTPPIVVEIAQRKILNIKEGEYFKSRFSTIILLPDGYFLTFNYKKADGDEYTNIMDNAIPSYKSDKFRFSYYDLKIRQDGVDFKKDFYISYLGKEYQFPIPNFNSTWELFTNTYIPQKKMTIKELKKCLNNVAKSDLIFKRYMYRVGDPDKYEEINDIDSILNINDEPKYVGCYKDNFRRTGELFLDYNCYRPQPTIEAGVKACHAEAKNRGNTMFAYQASCCIHAKNKHVTSTLFDTVNENSHNISMMKELNSMYDINISTDKNNTHSDQYFKTDQIKSISDPTEAAYNTVHGLRADMANNNIDSGHCVKNNDNYGGAPWMNAIYEVGGSNTSNNLSAKLILDEDANSHNFGLYIQTYELNNNVLKPKDIRYILKIKDYYPSIESDDLMSNPQWDIHNVKYNVNNDNVAMKQYDMFSIGGGSECIISKSKKIRAWIDIRGIWRFELSLHPGGSNFGKIKDKILGYMKASDKKLPKDSTNFFQPTQSSSSSSDLFVYHSKEINGSLYNQDYLRSIYRVSIVDNANVANLSNTINDKKNDKKNDNISNLFLQFENTIKNDVIASTNPKQYYLYKLKNTTNNLKCKTLKPISNAIIFNNFTNDINPINKKILEKSKYGNILTKSKKLSLAVSYEDCKTKCSEMDECRVMTHNDSNECNLYDETINQYIIESTTQLKNFSSNQKLYMKSCTPQDTLDPQLENAGFIRSGVTHVNMLPDKMNPNNSYITIDRLPGNIPILEISEYIKKNDPELLPTYNEVVKNISWLPDDKDKFIKYSTFLESDAPKQIKDILTRLHSKINALQNKKPTAKSVTSATGNSNKIVHSQVSGFQNINEYNTNNSFNIIENIKVDNDILEKSEIFTNNIDEIIKLIIKQTYNNKFNSILKNNNYINNNSNNNYNFKVIILLIFIAIILFIIIFLLIKKRPH